MRLLIDMNLSPEWITVIQQAGWEAQHWSTVGDPRATDQVIIEWAKANNWVIFTHDLDFGTLLALTQASGPSVIQVRTQDVTPAHLAPLMIEALTRHETTLDAGALLIIDEGRLRVRILPLTR